MFTTVTSDTVSSGVRRSFTNPSKFSLDPTFQEKAAFAPWWANLITGTVSKYLLSMKKDAILVIFVAEKDENVSLFLISNW